MKKEWVLIFMTCVAIGSGAKTDLVRPNVLFIAIDDLRPELGCYGATQIKTPNIDRFAEQALVFNRAYCQIPVCGASRASLMTGILPTAQRFVDFASWAEKDAPNAVTLPQAFREAGYTTLASGKLFHHSTDTADRSWSEPVWHASGMGHAYNYDPATTNALSKRGRGRIYESPDVADDAYADGKAAQRTIEDLQRLKESGEPFFYALGLIRPHMPFYAPKKYWDLYSREKVILADNQFRPENAPKALRGSSEYKSYHPGEYKDGSEEWHRMMRHGYYASTSYADQLTGDVLNELERLGLAENTIVVIWGDHGWHLGEHGFWGKHNTMHNALQVPLIIRVPGAVSGRESDALVEVVDLFPTLCSFAGVSVPSSVQGRSFDALFSDPNQDFRDCAYSRFKNADAVVTERYVYTRYDNGETMLYDRKKDPEENRNVAANPEYRDTIGKLERLLQNRMKQAEDATYDG
jgi:iduronate 2-sulfatase